MSRVWSVIPGSFHLLHIMLDEYVYLVMETQRDQSRDLHLQRLVQRHMKNAGVDLCVFTFFRLVEKNPEVRSLYIWRTPLPKSTLRCW